MSGADARPGERRFLVWGCAGSALEGTSGDVHVVAERADGALVAVIDGLGHGVEAAAAAQAAARILAASAGEPLDRLVSRCHDALRRTRGAVMSLAALDARTSSITWGGIGNVEGVLLRADPGAARRPRESIVLRGGIVGYHLPALHVSTLPVGAGDTLILATDGVHDGFGEDASVRAAPQDLADAILARHARGNDDALVLVARWLGAGEAADGAGEGVGA